MRRFFQAHRTEDYSQIQYLTAKCTRLAHDKAVLERDFLLSRERERKLQTELEAVMACLRRQEQLNTELRARQEQLVGRIQQQQELVDVLQQRLVLLVEESCRDAELLRQVSSELLCLQGSELRLEGLMEELHAEAQDRAALSESLRSELCRKLAELEELQDTNKTLTEELEGLRATHQKEVSELQRENQASVGKLQQTAEQCEWLCQQQRYWMFCVKRFKECLMEERRALLQEVSVLERKAAKIKFLREISAQSVARPPQDTAIHDSGAPTWDTEAEPECQVEKSNTPCGELFDQPFAGSREQRNGTGGAGTAGDTEEITEALTVDTKNLPEDRNQGLDIFSFRHAFCKTKR